MCSPQQTSLFTLVIQFHDRQSSERCIRKFISRHCLEKIRTRQNDHLFLITDDRDFRPQTCINGLGFFRECKHIKNILEDVYFTKNSLHITLKIQLTDKHIYKYDSGRQTNDINILLALKPIKVQSSVNILLLGMKFVKL